MAKRMARALIETMLAVDVDAVIINSAGCGSTMKEYREIFADESSYLPRVLEFESKVRDFGEYLASLPRFRSLQGQLSRADVSPVPTVYQDACHLRHAQRVVSQPRSILSVLPSVRLVELALPDQCCGSAGVYNVQHPELANRILSPKIEDIRASGAEVVVSGNPGCMLQLRKGLKEAGLKIPVKHLATVVDEAIIRGEIQP